MANLKSDISDILSELIKRKGLSMPEIARRTKIPQPTIYRIAQGEHQRPHNKTLKALSDFFNVSIDQLLGIEPLGPLVKQVHASQLPILNCKQVIDWPQVKHNDFEYILFDKKISTEAFALRMPDKSMEPLITKDAILIVDPTKEPEYRSLVIVKLYNLERVIIRQLIKDANNFYIKPINQDFDSFEMVMLTEKDLIMGTVIEARFNCEAL